MAKIKVTLTETRSTVIEIEVMDAVLESAIASARVADPAIFIHGRPNIEWSKATLKVKEVQPC